MLYYYVRKGCVYTMTKRTFSREYKESILQKLRPPENRTVPEVAKEEGISTSTIYTWVSKARNDGQMIPNSSPSHDQKWRKEDKMRIVIETFSFNEAELSEYCREHGLYTTDVMKWRKIAESAFGSSKPSKELEDELSAQKKKNEKLQKNLDRKDKALAEAAALLVLEKKMKAIWGDPEDE